MPAAKDDPIQPIPRLEKPFASPYLLTHPKILQPARELALAACNPADGDIGIATGPAGVGLGTFCRLVTHFMELTFQTEMEQDRFLRPALTVPLHSKPEQGFNFNTYYRSAMKVAGEMLPDQKSLRPWVPPAGAERFLTGYINMLTNMGVRVVLLYQGQEIAKAGSWRIFFRNFDQMRTLALLAPKTLHVLVGDYRLLGVAPTNGQIGGRIQIFHIDRYRDSKADDKTAFAKLGRILTTRISKFVDTDLQGCEDIMLGRTNGGIATLCRWLHHAYVHAKSEGAVLNETVLIKKAPLRSILEVQAQEALIGEHRLAQLRSGSLAPNELSLVGLSADGRRRNPPLEISAAAIEILALPKPPAST